MKTQPFLSYFYYSLLLSILTLALSSCKEDNYDPVLDDHDPATVSDIDGNVYPTVAIGNQLWITANLRTTHYRDGSIIDFPGPDTLKWQTNTNGAYAWQNNDETNKDLYGGLYNWHAINNTSGLCPTGWRVSTVEDWNTLIKYLFEEHGCTNDYSGDKHTGNVLKSCRQVNSPMGEDCNTSDHPRWNFHETQIGTDEFGFAALPSGSRGPKGKYSSMGSYGYWWAHDPINDKDLVAQHRYINFDQNRVYGGQKIDKSIGLSVRCVKNF